MVHSLLHRREAIILTSVDIIDELGIQGLSTREVARRQDISEGTIFKHFRNKNELMIAILEHYSKYDADIAESIKLKDLKPLEAVKYYVNAYAEYYQNYPQMTAIEQAYDILSCDPLLRDKVNLIFQIRSVFLDLLIKEASKYGEIYPGIDTEKLADIIWGSFRGICLKWRLNSYGFGLKEYILSTLEMILNAFSK